MYLGDLWKNNMSLFSQLRALFIMIMLDFWGGRVKIFGGPGPPMATPMHTTQTITNFLVSSFHLL